AMALATVLTGCGVEAQGSQATGNSAAAATKLPGGSYDQSCSNCRISGDTLRCSCRAVDQSSHRTSLDVSSCKKDYVANCDGKLQCGECDGSDEGDDYG